MTRLSKQHATVEMVLERKSLYCTLIFALCGIHISKDESNAPAICYEEFFGADIFRKKMKVQINLLPSS
jgi:hypothetical protein